MDIMILQGPDHLETRTVTHVGEPWIAMAAEIALQDTSIRSPVENGAPCLQLPHTRGSLLGMQFGHPLTVQILTATHGVGEMDTPGITIVDVGKSGGDAALRHDRMSLAEQ